MGGSACVDDDEDAVYSLVSLMFFDQFQRRGPWGKDAIIPSVPFISTLRIKHVGWEVCSIDEQPRTFVGCDHL